MIMQITPTLTASAGVERLSVRGIRPETVQVCGPRCQSFSAVPLTLYGRIAPGWAVHKPLMVTLEQDEDGNFVASEVLFAIYGVGATQREALADFVTTLIDYYQLTRAHTAQDKDTQPLFRRLRDYVSPVRA